MARIDFTGQKFGKLTVIKLDSIVDGKLRWKCLCECGNTTIVRASNIRMTKSCGCIHREVTGNINLSHGESGSKEYIAWAGMRGRCYNKRNPRYSAYGGRGVKVCDKWNEGFLKFLEDMGRAPSPKHSIERINVNGNYEPKNCRWATPKEQANNRRYNHKVIFRNKHYSIPELAEKTGLSYSYINNRTIRIGKITFEP